jgi:hypothetical protein
MGTSDESSLHEVIWSFHDALQRRDGLEDRLRRGQATPDLAQRSLAASEAVVHARLALYRVLLAQGWTPPSSVIRQLGLDSQLLRDRTEIGTLTDL